MKNCQKSYIFQKNIFPVSIWFQETCTDPGIRLVKAQPNVINLSGRDEAFGGRFWFVAVALICKSPGGYESTFPDVGISTKLEEMGSHEGAWTFSRTSAVVVFVKNI